MRDDSRRTALIVGAGIGGLAAALSLKRIGWNVRVFEKAASPRELGFALALAPNAMMALGELGLEHKIVAQGFRPGSAEVRRIDGRVIRRLDKPSAAAGLGGSSMVALRQILHGALLDAVGREPLELECEVVSFSSDGPIAQVHSADGRSEQGDIIVGADGVASIVRKQLHPAEGTPRETGYCGLRGVAYGAIDNLSGLDAVAYFGPGLEAATVRAGHDAIYWYVSMLAVDVGPGSHNAADILRRYLPRFDEPLRRIAGATQPDDVRFDYLFDRTPIQQWGAGPVTLLGDAAHPMLPHAGQGAAQALEDAVALGIALDRSGSDVVGALRRYETVRANRTREIVTLARRIAGITTTTNVVMQSLRTAAIRMTPGWMLGLASKRAQRDPHRALREASDE